MSQGNGSPREQTRTFLHRMARGNPFEVRILNCHEGNRKPFPIAGYFDDVDAAVREIHDADERYQPAGTYITLNQIDPALLSRAANRLEPYPENTTTDNNVSHRTRLLLDFDPVRPTGIASTNDQVAQAAEMAEKVYEWLRDEFGWPDPILQVNSGNGQHLLYAIDLPNDDESALLVQQVLQTISSQFSNAQVDVDTGNFNASRIAKIPGTMARKGGNTEDRPWRMAELVWEPDKRTRVSQAKLEAVAGLAEAESINPSARNSGHTEGRTTSNETARSRLLVEGYLSHYGVAFRRIDGVDNQGRTRWALERCPFHDDHGGRDTVILQGEDGKLGFHCFHARCSDKTWQDAKAAIGRPLPEHYDPPLGSTSFANFHLVGGGDGGATTPVGLSINDITDDLFDRTGGWPKRVGSDLFCSNDDHQVHWLKSPNELLAWIDGQSRVNWKRGSDKITQERLFAHLQMSAESYQDVVPYPHWPALPGVYYMHDELPDSDGSCLGQLIDRFSPATALDRELLLAFVLSLFWGGMPGSRPAWLFTGSNTQDEEVGRGVGKSIASDILSQIAGGFIEISPHEDIAKIKTRLLSSGARHLRVARLDNVKTYRFSWGDLEGLITSPVISGHQLYRGEGRRPNTLTWALTLNGASLSKDMAQRVIVVHVARPTYQAEWEQGTRRFIEENRWQIVADIINTLRQ